MPTPGHITLIRRAALGLTVVALAAGGSLTLAAPAVATPYATTPATVAAAPPAKPGVPDVGASGEIIRRQLVPTIDPQGRPVWPSTDGGSTSNATARGGWTAVVSVAAGARIRTTPVTGVVIGLIPLRAYYWVSCTTRGADGYLWGYATHAGRYGWVRRDLWEIVRYTAPGAPAPRPIPSC